MVARAERVAVPILHASVRLKLLKGRQWSLIEHAVLCLVVAGADTVSSLSEGMQLPHRVVIESLIRLMKAGWLEMAESRDGLKFRATASGVSAASQEELPRITSPISRIGVFCVDPFLGTCFSARDISVYSKSKIEEVNSKEPRVKVLEWPASRSNVPTSEAMSVLLAEDEQYVGCDELGIIHSERYMVVTVRGTEIDGLPESAPLQLRKLILDQATGGETTDGKLYGESTRVSNRLEQTVDIHFDKDDGLIVGGPAHLDAITRALSSAVSLVVIHSTFLRPEAFNILRPALVAACDRGVRVHILWGQSEDSKSPATSSKAISQLQRTLRESGSGVSIQFHGFSTGSHAKMVLYDDEKYPLVAILGSCNWMSSGFDSVECSVRLRDPKIVGLLTEALAELARPAVGHWSALSADLAGYAANLSHSSLKVRGVKTKATLVLAGGHARLVRAARDSAQIISVGSHRVSLNAKSLFFEPVIAAMKIREVRTEVSFGKLEPGVSSVPSLLRSCSAEKLAARFQIREITSPRFHAKFLFWDDNNLVVTSQNWLSADPGDTKSFDELGVHLEGHGVAAKFSDLMADEIRCFETN